MVHPRILSVFSGIGGLELGLRAALPGSRVLGYIEQDPIASSVLLERMEESALEPAPVFIGDVRDVDGREFRDQIDLVVAGFPCQDLSFAGPGDGIHGRKSGLWGELVRIIRETQPAAVFLENVAAIAHRGLEVVLHDLAELGLNAEWTCLDAASCGAPHLRARWFCLAWAEDCLEALKEWPVAYGHREGESGEEAARIEGGGWPGDGLPLFPPLPDDLEAWTSILESRPYLIPAIESDLCVVVNGASIAVGSHRGDALQLLGNACVPVQASVAFLGLRARALGR